MFAMVYHIANCISIFIFVSIFGYSSTHGAHIRRVTLYNCTSEYTSRFLFMNAARDVKLYGVDWDSSDTEILCTAKENR